eukprot:CAMPEP_0206455544 /NCGR_PEP_ID=MMETSP0324_2-20121206/21816_1 /ASSEMBLY_ACC=CAM_ASM_000836 /TAXON_ID=2866 /ORGANISM="Crypthecodinium cohnii, Strain Seligo" /LENGTH=488 /DNA_ID=CAMNT_0053926269 /DNA_START=38 /DNA_END=1501 /DNA_ORIENTATION=+
MTTQVKWMWGDAHLFSTRAARLNPLRWSRTRTLQEAIDDLAQHALEVRPVRLRFRTSEGWATGGRRSSTGGDSPRSVRSDWSQASHATTTNGSQVETNFPSVAAAIAELKRLAAGHPMGLGGVPENGVVTPNESPKPSLVRSNSVIVKETPTFRFEEREKIPNELLEGPFEDFEISNDVYTTAYLVARNATPDMYSFSPFVNPQVRIVWKYLFFILGSQLTIILALTWWYPPTVMESSWLVDCSNATALEPLVEAGALLSTSAEECLEAGELSFEADVRGRTISYHRIEHSVPFFDAILLEGKPMVYVLRLICCAWQFGQVYFEDFDSIRRLFDYHDFSQWFLPIKGEDLRPSFVLIIPLVQFSILLIVTTVSFMVLCAQTEAFDIVMNSLAFTFIAQVGAFFNGPLAQHLGETYIRPPPYGNDSIAYLYPEYSIANAVNEDGTYTDGGWYICEDEVGKAGLLSDYKIRHNPEKYDHHCRKIVATLEW